VKKILIIDDEELTLRLLEKVLIEEGYLVELASNGESGLELFRRNPADLVITDMVMPVKDGLKTILELREIDENVPVVAISGGGAISKERYLAVAGLMEHVRTLAKPFTKTEILEVIRELLY
jgi:DNA-binding response OmpR family regulator